MNIKILLISCFSVFTIFSSAQKVENDAKKMEKYVRHQTPVAPFPYTTEEVTFSNGEACLSGTLTLPERWTKRTPVVIMVTGSGLQNRDEELFGHRPFAVIADAFARHGIATLRYDDRGFAKSTGDAKNATTDDFRDDALAGIAMLRERFSRVGVLGHSEGGTIGVMLAADNKVDFVISLAGMFQSGRQTLLKQNRDALTRAGFSQENVDAYCAALEKGFDAAVEGKEPPEVDLPFILARNFQVAMKQVQTPYLRRLLSLDVSSQVPRVKCPVFAANGTLDTQVDSETNLSLLAPISGRKTNVVKSYYGLNHLFQHCTTGTVAEYGQIEETISPEVLADMVEWIVKTTNTKIKK